MFESTGLPLQTPTDTPEPPLFDESWRYLRWLGAIVVAGLAVTVMIYGEPFRLWAYPFSWAGRTRTLSGLPNHAAMVAYTATTLLASAASLAAYAYYRRTSSLPFRRSRMLLAGCAAFGFVGGVAPSDIAQPAHIAGSAVMFGSLWFLACIQIELVRRASWAGQQRARLPGVASVAPGHGAALRRAVPVRACEPRPGVETRGPGADARSVTYQLLAARRQRVGRCGCRGGATAPFAGRLGGACIVAGRPDRTTP